MPTFAAADGIELAYHVLGDGPPLICLPGGPMQASAYLGELGGLSAHRRLILLDLRGTGNSAASADKTSYRCDRLVDDVEALREHLGLERMDLLSHSAGTNLAARYVERHPDRVSRLVLVTPSPAGVDITATAEQRREVAQLRRGEPWFEAASAAFERVASGQAEDDDWGVIAPFWYGRWDAAAQAHKAAEAEQMDAEISGLFRAEGAFDPQATRAALAVFPSPVLLIAGEVDLNTVPGVVAEYAGLFPDAEFVVQPGASHFPWLDDPFRFTGTVTKFLV